MIYIFTVVTWEIHYIQLQQTDQEGQGSLAGCPSPNKASTAEEGFTEVHVSQWEDVDTILALFFLYLSSYLCIFCSRHSSEYLSLTWYLIWSRNQSSGPWVTVLIDWEETHSCKHWAQQDGPEAQQVDVQRSWKIRKHPRTETYKNVCCLFYSTIITAWLVWRAVKCISQ